MTETLLSPGYILRIPCRVRVRGLHDVVLAHGTDTTACEVLRHLGFLV
jgi:hypothetical protein